MPLVNAKCTNCGANLSVDNTKDAAMCPYCGTAYIVEKAITNFNTYNQNSYNVEHADFFIDSEAAIDRKISAAETIFEETKDFQKAYEIFEEVSKEAPNRWHGWYGMAKVKTKNFTLHDYRDPFYDEVAMLMKNAIAVAPNDWKADLQAIFNSYTEADKRLKQKKADEELERLREINKQSHPLWEEKIKEEETYKKASDEWLKWHRKKTFKWLYIPAVILLIFGVFMIFNYYDSFGEYFSLLLSGDGFCLVAAVLTVAGAFSVALLTIRIVKISVNENRYFAQSQKAKKEIEMLNIQIAKIDREAEAYKKNMIFKP